MLLPPSRRRAATSADRRLSGFSRACPLRLGPAESWGGAAGPAAPPAFPDVRRLRSACRGDRSGDRIAVDSRPGRWMTGPRQIPQLRWTARALWSAGRCSVAPSEAESFFLSRGRIQRLPRDPGSKTSVLRSAFVRTAGRCTGGALGGHRWSPCVNCVSLADVGVSVNGTDFRPSSRTAAGLGRPRGEREGPAATAGGPFPGGLHSEPILRRTPCSRTRRSNCCPSGPP
jgi:hypothetical protein